MLLYLFVKISAKVCYLYKRQLFKLKNTERHNSYEEYKWLWFLFSAYHKVMRNMCTKFHENTFDSFNVVEGTRFSLKSGYNCPFKI